LNNLRFETFKHIFTALISDFHANMNRHVLILRVFPFHTFSLQSGSHTLA